MAASSDWSSKDSIREMQNKRVTDNNGTEEKTQHEESGYTMEPAEAIREPRQDEEPFNALAQNDLQDEI
jgi:hypothetical protein